MEGISNRRRHVCQMDDWQWYNLKQGMTGWRATELVGLIHPPDTFIGRGDIVVIRKIDHGVRGYTGEEALCVVGDFSPDGTVELLWPVYYKAPNKAVYLASILIADDKKKEVRNATK